MDSKNHVREMVSKSKCLWGLVALAVILAIAIPPAVVVTLRKRNAMGPKSAVFIPLYVYPAPGAWEPLEDMYVFSGLFSWFRPARLGRGQRNLTPFDCAQR
jgi:hypothetical protein